MANKNLFRSALRAFIPDADAVNEAGGRAYKFSAKQALAQYAATGCLNGTYYASNVEQLTKVLELCRAVDSNFLAKTAIYARETGYMKDMPALLVAQLATRDRIVFERIFDRVIDNGKMLRNFVQIMRSGQVGRRSLGACPKRLVQNWLDSRSDGAVFRASVGASPSLADVIKMVHPKPASASRRALYAYLIGRPYDVAALPGIVRHYEAYKVGQSAEVPKVPFQMLTSLDLDADAWRAIARNASWQMTRMNLNTFARQGVFEDDELTALIAERLASPELVRGARAFPYQLMVAAMNAGDHVPGIVRDALSTAMDVALSNVPRIEGTIHVLPDVSGSMHSPVTGYRRGSTSSVRCIDVAALVAAAFQRVNSKTEILPFHDRVVECRLNARDGVMRNAAKLANLPSGGTDCSAPLARLNRLKAKGDLVIFVSDNESWMDSGRTWHNDGTAVMVEWTRYRTRNPQAKLVCIDIQPYSTTQAPSRPDILNVGGFSDGVFRVIGDFVSAGRGADHWVDTIESVSL
jgi:60 kDa SS-A/Ro ribonucleoprotein